MKKLLIDEPAIYNTNDRSMQEYNKQIVKVLYVKFNKDDLEPIFEIQMQDMKIYDALYFELCEIC